MSASGEEVPLPDLAATMRALRHEVGPTRGSRNQAGTWQPMVTAAELWVLLDALEARVPVQERMAAEGASPPHPDTMISRR